MSEQVEIEVSLKMKDTAEFQTVITSIEKTLTSLKSELALLENQFNGNANSMEALQQKQEVLNKLWEAGKNKVESAIRALKSSQQEYERLGSTLEQTLGKYDEENRKLEELKNIYGENSIEVALQVDALQRLESQINKGNEEYAKAGVQVREWETELNNATIQLMKEEEALKSNSSYLAEASQSAEQCATSIDEFGNTVEKSATDPLTELSKALTDAGVSKKVSEVKKALMDCAEKADEFDTAMAKITTVADQTELSGSKMKQAILELSSETGKSALEIAEAMNTMVSEGIDTEAAMAAVESAVKLSVGSYTDQSKAVDILTKAMGSYNLKAEDAAKVADILTAAQEASNTSVENISDALGQVIPTAADYGVQLDELAAIYVTMTKNGATADEAASAMKTALGELGDTGSKVGKILMEETGMSFSEMMTNGSSLGDVLGILSESAEGNSEAFRNLWSSSEAGNGMLPLLSSGMNDYTTALREMQSSMGDTEAAFGLVAESSDYAKQKLENSINNLKIAIGEELQPVLNEMRELGSKAFDWATDYVKQNPAVVSAVVGVTTAMGALAGGLAVFTALPKITNLFAKFNAVLNANPYVLVGTAVAGLVAAVITYSASLKETNSEYQYLAENAQKVTDKLSQTNQSISEGNQNWEQNRLQMEAEGNLARKLVGELDALAAKENKTAEEKAKIAEKVSNLNTLIPGLNLAFDQETGALSKTTEEMLKLVDAHTTYAKVSAATERLQEIGTQQFELDIREEEIKAGIQEYKDAIDELSLLQMTYAGYGNNAVVNYKGQDTSVLGAVTQISEEIAALQTELEESGLELQLVDLDAERKRLTGLENLVTDYIQDANDVAETTNKTGSSAIVFGETIEVTRGLKQSSEEMAYAFWDAQKAAKEEAESVSVLANTAENAGIVISGVERKSTESAKALAEARKESMRAIVDSYDEMVQSITSDLQNKVSLFDKFDGGTDMTTEEMNANLNDQIEGLINYQENLAKVKAMMDGEGNALISPEFFQYIQDMGVEGANMLEHLVYTYEEQGEYGIEQIRSMNEKYGEAMNLTENIAEAAAANQIAYKSAMGEFASSEADFSDLRDSIDYAVEYAGEGWAGLSEETRAELEDMINLIKACGGQIPEGLAEGIESGETEPQGAIDQMKSSLEGQFDGLLKVAEKNGIQVDEYLKDGIKVGEDDVVKAFAAIIEDLAAYDIDLEEVGQKGGETFASGVESQAEAASNAANATAEGYKTAGGNLIKAMAQGISSLGENVKTEVFNASEEGTAGVEAYGTEYQMAGLMLAMGFARGISQGRSQAIHEAVQMAVQALEAAKKALEIQSPSKKFMKDVGAQIPKGMAFGIKTQKVLAKNASDEMSREVLKGATEWLDDYRENHQVSLEDEEYFWKEVLKRTKKGSSAYKEAQKELNQVSSVSKKIKNNFDVSRQEDGKTKDEADYYSEIYSAANKYMSNMKILRNVSLEDEEAYWKAVLKQLKKGTQAWYDAKSRLKDIQKEKQEEKQDKKQEQKDYAVSGNALDTYKTYYKVSAQSEVDYWNIVRKKFKQGTKEREEADKKYFEAKQNLNDELIALEEDYYDKVSEVNEKMEEDIKDLTEEYESAVEDRADAIYSSFGLADKFESETDDGATLLYNLQTQVTGLEDWGDQLEKLKERGVDEELIEELQAMGPEASAMLHVLNNDLPEGMEGKGMTEEQLQQYVELWRQKKELSRKLAEEESEQLKNETDLRIADIRKSAQEEIKAYTEEYLLGVEALTTPITRSLKNLANNALKWGEETVSSFVQGLDETVTSKNSISEMLSVSDVITKNLAGLEINGKKIGENTLDGILKAMNDSEKIGKSASKLVKAIVAATKKEAKISSPSRLFEEEVGAYIPAGVGEGIEKNTLAAVKPAETMILQMLDAAEAKQQSENEKLTSYVQDMNFDSGIAQLNAALQTPIANTTNVNVDNSGLAGMFTQILEEMKQIVQSTNDRQIVLDDGTLVGKLQPKLSQESGQISRRLNRGKY